MPNDAVFRTFVALPLSEFAHQQLDDVQHRLKRSCPERAIRWVPPDNIHLTLFFLGDTSADRLETIYEALAAAVQSVTCVPFQLGGLGVFPAPARPRVIWVGIEDPTEGLALLHLAVNEALASLGFEPDHRPFKPHLTLGRVQRKASPAEARATGAVVANLEIGVLAEETAAEVVLFRSVLKSTGAEYQRLKTLTLPPVG